MSKKSFSCKVSFSYTVDEVGIDERVGLQEEKDHELEQQERLDRNKMQEHLVRKLTDRCVPKDRMLLSGHSHITRRNHQGEGEVSERLHLCNFCSI